MGRLGHWVTRPLKIQNLGVFSVQVFGIQIVIVYCLAESKPILKGNHHIPLSLYTIESGVRTIAEDPLTVHPKDFLSD